LFLSILWLNAILGRLVVACEAACIRSFAGNCLPCCLRHDIMFLLLPSHQRRHQCHNQQPIGRSNEKCPDLFRFLRSLVVGGGGEWRVRLAPRAAPWRLRTPARAQRKPASQVPAKWLAWNVQWCDSARPSSLVSISSRHCNPWPPRVCQTSSA
jgi:hypothetical protein